MDIDREIMTDKEANRKDSPLEEGKNMALLARPSESMIKIDSSKSTKFLEDSRKNTITPEFLRKCQQSAKLLNKKK